MNVASFSITYINLVCRQYDMERIAKIFQDTFYNVASSRFYIINDFLAMVTIVAVLGIILETIPSLAIYHGWFEMIEYVAVGIFTLEYIGRIIANYRHVRRYLFGFFGIIDLLSIVPTYLSLTNLLFLKAIRVLRILRLLRMIHLAKVAHIERDMSHDPEDSIHLYRLSVRIYFFTLLSSIVIYGTFIHVAEGNRPEFSSIPLGMIWAAKVSLGGVAQYMPQTIAGDLITIAARFTGLALFGLMISLIGNRLRWILFGTPKLASTESERLS